MKNQYKSQRIILVFISVLTFSLLISAQQSKSTKKSGKIAKDSIYWLVDKSPEFPGGQFAMSTFMYKNLKYPQKAIANKNEGTVSVDFVISKTGEISDLRVTSKGTSTELNNEVLRVIKLMPHFVPAEQKKKKVSYRTWGVTIDFQLKPCNKKEFYPIIITPTDCGLPTFSPDAKGVYTFAEKMPQYPGGDVELLSFISRNKYHFKPEDDNPPTGTVIIRFIVTETGEISNIKLIRSIDKDLDDDAIRVVKMLPKWKPGVHDGRKVNVYYNLPVSYRLE
jgi:TonB family protein